MVRDARPPDGDAASGPSSGSTPLCDLRFIAWVRQVVGRAPPGRRDGRTTSWTSIRATRDASGARSTAPSPRAANMLAAAARAAAVLDGRDFVIPDDMKGLFKPLAAPPRACCRPAPRSRAWTADRCSSRCWRAGAGAAMSACDPPRSLASPPPALPRRAAAGGGARAAVAALADVSGMLALALGVDVLWAPRRKAVAASVEMPGTLYIGDEEEAVLTVEVPHRPAGAGGGGGRSLGRGWCRSRRCGARISGGKAVLRFRLVPLRRGRIVVERAWVR